MFISLNLNRLCLSYQRKGLPMTDNKYDFNDLLEIIKKLRAPGGCVWDREQTHKSVKTGLIEETYEVLEAIDKENDTMLTEELGDLLLQVIFHTQIATEEERFNVLDVTDGVCRKMIYRHPHVFGDVSVENSEQVLQNWEVLKKAEKNITCQADVLRNVPSNLPALMRAEKIQKKAAQVGFDWENIEDVFDKVEEELDELRDAYKKGDRDNIIEEMGDLLFAAVNLSRFVKVNPELSLTAASEKFIGRFSSLEEAVCESGRNLSDMSLREMDEVWEFIKKKEKQETGYEN